MHVFARGMRKSIAQMYVPNAGSLCSEHIFMRMLYATSGPITQYICSFVNRQLYSAVVGPREMFNQTLGAVRPPCSHVHEPVKLKLDWVLWAI